MSFLEFWVNAEGSGFALFQGFQAFSPRVVRLYP